MIKNELKKWREGKGLNQTEAAKRLKITLRSLQNWEQGTRRPHPIVARVLRDRMAAGQ